MYFILLKRKEVVQTEKENTDPQNMQVRKKEQNKCKKERK